jgi:hypothetical protein
MCRDHGPSKGLRSRRSSGPVDVPALGGTPCIGRRRRRLIDAVAPREPGILVVPALAKRVAAASGGCETTLRCRGADDADGRTAVEASAATAAAEREHWFRRGVRDGAGRRRPRVPIAFRTSGDGCGAMKHSALWSSEHGTGSSIAKHSPRRGAATRRGVATWRDGRHEPTNPTSGSGPRDRNVAGEKTVEGVRNSADGTCRVRQTREKRTLSPMSLKGRQNPRRGRRGLRFPTGGEARALRGRPNLWESFGRLRPDRTDGGRPRGRGNDVEGAANQCAATPDGEELREVGEPCEGPVRGRQRPKARQHRTRTPGGARQRVCPRRLISGEAVEPEPAHGAGETVI